MLSTQDKSISTAAPTSLNLVSTEKTELGASLLGTDPLGLLQPKVDNRKRFLRFTFLEKRDALLSLENILEVMPLTRENILPVPDMPSCIVGICSWQGETLWLVDLNALVGHESLYRSSSLIKTPSVIVVQHNNQTLGLVVEQVSDIDLLDEATIQMDAGMCPTALEPFILGHCLEQDSIVLSVPAIVNAPQLNIDNSEYS